MLRRFAGLSLLTAVAVFAGCATPDLAETQGAHADHQRAAGGDDDDAHDTKAPKTATKAATTTASTTAAGERCVERGLTFSADELPSLPASGVWGGNATDGESAPYSAAFAARAKEAHARGLEVFAYLEGPCGDTGGVDDGERGRCEGIHQAFNAANAPGTPNTPEERWKPFTMRQLEMSGAIGADYCEIDNLSNNVTIPLNPLLRELKQRFDAGKIHCRIVLKNVDVSDLDAIRAEVAKTPADARFIAPFHIFEADDTSEKAALDAAMVRLKGRGAVTIVSTDTNAYGSAFTPDKFLACTPVT